jgi:hypothetical protein
VADKCDQHGACARRSDQALAPIVRIVACLLASSALFAVACVALNRDNADAFVSMFRHDELCDVRRHLEDSKTTMPCTEVGRYLRQTLNISRGGTVAIFVSGDTTQESLSGLTAPIKREGFKIVSVLRISIAEP